MKKIVFITGASSGFGKQTAKQLLKEGYIVYGAARRTEKMEDLKNVGAHTLKMDVTNDTDIEKGIKQIIDEQGKIDILINNAGFGMYGTIENISMEDIQYQYNVNVFGIARLIKAVLPHMRNKRNGLIINVASLVGHISMAGLGWYASTKHAIEAVSDALRHEVKHLGINVVLIEPGAVKTEFDQVALNALDNHNHNKDYNFIVEGFKNYNISMYSKCPGPESTVNAILKAIKAKKPKIRYKTTPDSKMIPFIRRLIGDRAFDNYILKELKKWSSK